MPVSAPLVTVTIPTYNSAATLGACLASIAAQDHPNVEIVVVDSHSADETLAIAQEAGARCLTVDAWLLGARVAGIEAARGDYVLLLDSDHVLAPSALSRAVALMVEVDALYFEERAIETLTLVQRLFDADRQLIQAQEALHADPLRGVLLRRFFRRDLLCEAVGRIPAEVVERAVTYDHEIINYEYARLSERVGLLPDAVRHHEVRTVFELWRKNVRYGRAARQMARLGYYADLRRAKARPRLGAWRPRLLWWGAQSTLLLALKAPAILIGYLLA
jgi:glycosyltransferase involved in cell wall biosynthesis